MCRTPELIYLSVDPGDFDKKFLCPTSIPLEKWIENYLDKKQNYLGS